MFLPKDGFQDGSGSNLELGNFFLDENPSFLLIKDFNQISSFPG
jgi:hypothetical protein